MDIIKNTNEIVNFLGEIPLITATIRVTDKCNLHCMQCYSRANSKSKLQVMEYEKIEKLLYHLKNKNVQRISITGGEPFMRADMVKILKKASELDFEIYISTNGTVLDIDFDELALTNIKVLQVSIDGLEATHNSIRGEKDAFKRSFEFIEKIKKSNRNILIGVAFTLMKKNYKDIIDVYEYCNHKSIDIFSIIPVQLMGRSQKEYMLEAKELKYVFDELVSYKHENNLKTELNFMVSPALVPAEMKGSKYEEGYVCTYPYSVAIDAEGKCAICDGLLDHAEFVYGDYSTGIENIYQSDVFKISAPEDKKDMRGVCSICKLFEKCGGGCRADAYLMTGNLNASDNLCQSFYDAGVFPKEYLNDDSDMH